MANQAILRIQSHEGDLYERDKGDLMKEYVANFHPWMIGLRGDTAQTKAVTDVYRMHAVKVWPEGAAPDEHSVNQSLITFWMGPEGEPVNLFPHDTSSEKMATVSVKFIVAPES